MSKQAVGGQALIEGVMMQSKEKRAIAVRKADGEIVIKKNKIKSSRFSIYSFPRHILSQLLKYQKVFSWEIL